MLIMFVVGAMNMMWIVVLAAIVAIEKFSTNANVVRQGVGIALIAAAVVVGFNGLPADIQAMCLPATSAAGPATAQ
jgi:predicted metal-binding membrane protein